MVYYKPVTYSDPICVILGIVERFSLKDQRWEQCPGMLEHRGSHGVVAIGNVLFAIGGGGLLSNLSSNEKLSCSMDNEQKWTSIASMPTARHALVIVSHQKYIYAVGGWIDGKICSSDVER